MLQNKSAVITGGARGIGLSIAEEFVKLGAKVVICSRTKSDIQKVLKVLNIKDKVAFGRVCDISKYEDCKDLIKFAKSSLGKIDVLINNAGIYGPIGQLDKIDLNYWHKTLEINLMGMIYCSSLIIPLMDKNGGGKIINLCGAGVGENKTMPNFTAYFTSKFAVAGFSEVLADELKGKNIQVNSISPGAVNTSLNEYLIKQGPKKSGREMYDIALKQKKEGGTPPQLAAKLIVYLASDEADHISGRLGYEKEWRFCKKISGGGELIDQGCHLIDLVNFFCGEMDQVTGYVTNLFWKTNLEDAAFFNCEITSGKLPIFR